MNSHSSAGQVDYPDLQNVINAAAKIQSMPPLRRALLSREALICAAGSRVLKGPAESKLQSILVFTGLLGLVPISLALLIRRIRDGRRFRARHSTLSQVIFVGIGALREVQLRDNITIEAGHAPDFVDQRWPEGFSALPVPRIGRVLCHWRKVTGQARAILKDFDSYFAPIDVLTSLVMRVHELAYLLALFEELRAGQPKMRIVFSTADLAAHAACISGFKPEYHQHGLLGRSLVFPDFSRMLALTSHEGRYVAERVSGLKVRVSSVVRRPSIVRPMLAIAGDYLATDSTPVTALVELVLSHGYQVVVRAHPRGHECLWEDIRIYEGVRFDSEGSFDDFLDKWRPAFLASWFSTTLLDGLLFGALPITFSKDKPVTVLPLDEISLAFPQQLSLIESCLISNEERSKEHQKLLNLVTE